MGWFVAPAGIYSEFTPTPVTVEVWGGEEISVGRRETEETRENFTTGLSTEGSSLRSRTYRGLWRVS